MVLVTNIIFSTFNSIQSAKTLRRIKSLTLPLRHLRARPRRNITGKERDSETGLYYYGARYLDPKSSRWLSGDPAVGEYVPVAPVSDEARKRNGNLPGMGGVFNYVNLHVYHYVGNNPVKYIDPDGKFIISATVLLVIGGATLLGTVGGFVGNHVANQEGATGWEKAGYIAGGVLIGGTAGAVGGYVAAPAIISATGIGAVSITGVAGITLIPATLLGQNHHVLTNPLMNALSNHSLSGLFQRAGSMVQALYKHSHNGYQAWHRAIDNNMVNWLQRYPNATSNQFWQELYKQYNTNDMIRRFGEGVLEYIKSQIN